MENVETKVAETTQNLTATETPTTTTPTTTTTTANLSATDKTSEAVKTTEAYTPNYKFKVKDEEKEFDDFLKPWVKDAETENKIRDLLTKAHGLEPLKTRLSTELETWKTKATDVGTKYETVSKSLETLSHYVKANDFDSFFDALKIPPQRIYQWVNRKIQEHEMPPEQRAEIEANRQAQHRLFLLEKQNQELQSQLSSRQVEQNAAMLDSALAKAEVAGIAQAFDTQVGQPGAFKNEVIKHGVALYAQHGRDYPVEYVVQDLLKTIGKVVTPQTANAMAATGATANPNVATKPPIIPNVQSRGGSPVKQAPRTLEELRTIARQM